MRVPPLEPAQSGTRNNTGTFSWNRRVALRQRDARRLAGMLLAAARAETEGAWPLLGGTSGAASNRVIAVDIRAARARFSELLKAAERGADITILRRTRRVARLVSAR